MKALLASCVCLFVLICGCARSSPPPQAHSKASLVVEQSTAAPGAQVNIGIQFVTDNGWHIYWQNPGDSGEPPRIQWQLPAGITAGALQWPTPTRINTPAGSDYGYQGTTVLLSSLQIPATIQPGAIELRGDLRWLVCHDICVPQQTQLAAPIRINSAAKMNEAAHQILHSAAEQLPKSLPANIRVVATGLPESFRLTLVSGEAIRRAEFFPAEQAQIDNAAQPELERLDGSVNLTVKKSEYLRQQPQHLKGVIILNGSDAYQIDAPVQATQKRGRNK